MATLAKVVYQFCSDEPSAANNHDLHFVIHVRLLLEGFLFNYLVISYWPTLPRATFVLSPAQRLHNYVAGVQVRQLTSGDRRLQQGIRAPRKPGTHSNVKGRPGWCTLSHLLFERLHI